MPCLSCRAAVASEVVTELVRGTGAIAKPGDMLTVQYVGRLSDGAEFDNSYPREPFRFTLGMGVVIRGWDLGLPGERVGGKRRLDIPPDLGYGARGYPPVIPPNARLVFDVELLDVQSPPTP